METTVEHDEYLPDFIFGFNHDEGDDDDE